MIRNKGLDILRIICALMVVFIHTNHQSVYILSLCTIAVPIFFMISGYLHDSHKSLKKQIVRILKILLITTASYFVIYFLLYGRNLEYAVKLLDKFRNYGFISYVSIYPVIVFALALLLSRLQNYCLRRISHG
ncbi:MAG: acyltransferase family protein [Erysipelotrichaceae bacterium]|nr:acyltransferase family protein [Erysipelotrichaceae bacterium]